ncbi:DUF2971 domain-containing protein [Caulobacter endophyticus]|uniref:DUF2971 domain-containing protein n=1 Tax=Caulobacter endophyticus TaxID=2172652 RepID=UPI002410B241|nr:DUF2971 domain-containing protein [Caulobacter endophyticus]MDG2531410.1 DUF2971 domain-containing protein [Caulobacter endophyticus]
MPLSEAYQHLGSLFFPHHLAARDEVERQNTRFAHYTSAAVAMSIIQDPYVWMRNALTMNDFSEMRHGLDCIIPAYKDPEVGGRLREFIEEIHPGLPNLFEERFNSWLPHFEQNTFLTSLSRHDKSEDEYGRLSMWRAYGQRNGVALILKNTPFMAETDQLKAVSSPVSYLTPQQYSARLKDIIDGLIVRRDEVAALDRDILFGSLFVMFKTDMLCTKHPGFAEEQEWRVYYSPGADPSPVIEPAFAVVEGVPQQIHRIPLRDDPANGLVGAGINSLLDRIIIGPSSQPLTMFNAFVGLLEKAGVENAAERVFVSDIPLRT